MKPVRNPEGVIEAIRRAISTAPELRVGQLIYVANGGEPFNVEDNALIEKLNKFSLGELSRRNDGK